MQLASAPRESPGQNERPSMAVQAAPAPAGGSLLVSRFLPTREYGKYCITLHRKLRSGLTGKYHANCHYSYNLPLWGILESHFINDVIQ